MKQSLAKLIRGGSVVAELSFFFTRLESPGGDLAVAVTTLPPKLQLDAHPYDIVPTEGEARTGVLMHESLAPISRTRKGVFRLLECAV